MACEQRKQPQAKSLRQEIQRILRCNAKQESDNTLATNFGFYFHPFSHANVIVQIQAKLTTDASRRRHSVGGHHRVHTDGTTRRGTQNSNVCFRCPELFCEVPQQAWTSDHAKMDFVTYRFPGLPRCCERVLTRSERACSLEQFVFFVCAL